MIGKIVRRYTSTTLSLSLSQNPGGKTRGLVSPDDLLFVVVSVDKHQQQQQQHHHRLCHPCHMLQRSLIDLSIFCAVPQPQYQP